MFLAHSFALSFPCTLVGAGSPTYNMETSHYYTIEVSGYMRDTFFGLFILIITACIRG